MLSAGSAEATTSHTRLSHASALREQRAALKRATDHLHRAKELLARAHLQWPRGALDVIIAECDSRVGQLDEIATVRRTVARLEEDEPTLLLHEVRQLATERAAHEVLS